MNAEGRWQGQADPPLSERGEAQAKALAEELAAFRLAVLYASDLARAHATARILGERIGLEPVVHRGLREMDVGAWSGLPHAEIERRWPDDYAAFRAGDPDVRPGGGESRRMLRARALATLEELGAWSASAAQASGTDRMAIVTHGGLLRVLRPGIRPANADHFWLEDPPESAGWSRGPEAPAADDPEDAL